MQTLNIEESMPKQTIEWNAELRSAAGRRLQLKHGASLEPLVARVSKHSVHHSLFLC